MKTIYDQLKILSESLKLCFEEQDWGIINADGKRLEEFIGVYASPMLSKEMRYQMFELILASANDALVDDLDDGSTILVIQEFIRRHGKDYPEQVSYWADLKESDDFPLADVLKNM